MKPKGNGLEKNVMTHERNKRTPLKNIGITNVLMGVELTLTLNDTSSTRLHETNRITHQNRHEKPAMKSLENCLVSRRVQP